MKNFGSQVLAKNLQPIRREIRHGGEYLREIVSLELTNAIAIDIEEAIAPRLDHQQEIDQQHGEEEDAMMRRGRGKGDRQ